MAVKWGRLIAIGMAALCLSGCVDAMPDMTEEENDIIAEYAATILLKHSNGYNYRLVDEEELEKAIFEENQALREAIAQAEAQEKEEQKADNEDSDSTGETQAGETQEGETITVETTAEDELFAEDVNLAEYLGLEEQYKLNFCDMEIVGTYPEAEDTSIFQINASKEKMLVVFHYELENITDEKLACDMMDVAPKISVKINDGAYKDVENTLLVNDLTTFISEIEAKTTVELVTVAEVPIEDIYSVDMKIMSGKEKIELKVH